MQRIDLIVLIARTGPTAVTAPIDPEATAAIAPIRLEAIAATAPIHPAVIVHTHQEVTLPAAVN